MHVSGVGGHLVSRNSAKTLGLNLFSQCTTASISIQVASCVCLNLKPKYINQILKIKLLNERLFNIFVILPVKQLGN